MPPLPPLPQMVGAGAGVGGGHLPRLLLECFMVAPTRSFAFDRAGSIELEQRLERGSLGASQWDAGVVTALP